VARARFAHAEVEVRRRGGALARRPHRTDAPPGRDPLATAHRECGEVEIGGVEAVARPDAHGQPRRAGRAREQHLAAGGRHHRSADRCRDVDASVLSGRVRVGPVAVLRDHLAADRPEPGGLGWGGESRGECEEGGEGEQESAHPATVRARGHDGGGGVAALLRFVTRT
jgi:hypothetical protein